MLLTNARLLFPERLARGHLRVAEGKIAAISDQPLAPVANEPVLDLGGQFLAPGFIDIHIHGAQRRDTMEASAEAFAAICRHHARGGTTALALTTVTATNEAILNVLRAAQEYRRQPAGHGAQVLGIHIEGPYFSKEKPGAHRLDLIRNPQRAEWEQWLAFDGLITQMTVAPELPGALELFEELAGRGVIPSGGHSDAWDEDAAAAFAHGMRHATHTFNCMSTARRRGPYRVAGLLEYVLSEPEILCELIADGHHVSPTLMRMLYLAKGPDGIVLVTDAAAGAGLAEGETFQLGDIDCVVRGGVSVLADGQTLASSTAGMIDLVRNMVQMVNVSLVEAVRMATLNPARALRMEARKGVLQVGADADLVSFTDDFQVTHTIVAGRDVL
ncbi:N-acetylglucosamine-6-phosphate deacetylase [Chthoniobacter flavus Ellin428]|uniref:N-acetylglucosamine-6-phosphate deacetylase n=1 Tax=Chthoniobacter flavus Ellin428 TaxID=497964 RepID=B4D0X3_9BACT|nr:N-acetylglucosamine-6-phosphate deacetylase [Chthoniobacter flavus]EDY19985.1 N-acetylglucosamine-6-phosphate deacetylase [Chthoniobacter flavus Ellin428]TCO91747.1 N-acetylglucosamine-6-phosphate deacetylase [Chthoniobacter flavus]